MSDATDICQFLLLNAPALFAHWKPGVLLQFVEFHLAQGTLFVVDGGVAIAWRGCRSEFLKAVREKREVFFWQPDDPHARTLWLAEFVSVKPGALNALAKRICERFENWRRLEVLTLRGETLVSYPAERLARLLT
jgi:hypothetical protein